MVCELRSFNRGSSVSSMLEVAVVIGGGGGAGFEFLLLRNGSIFTLCLWKPKGSLLIAEDDDSDSMEDPSSSAEALDICKADSLLLMIDWAFSKAVILYSSCSCLAVSILS